MSNINRKKKEQNKPNRNNYFSWSDLQKAVMETGEWEVTALTP